MDRDYCDGCGPAVTELKATATMPDGHVFRFCGHCTNRHKVALAQIGAGILYVIPIPEPAGV